MISKKINLVDAPIALKDIFDAQVIEPCVKQARDMDLIFHLNELRFIL
jgi:hypothetical protein